MPQRFHVQFLDRVSVYKVFRHLCKEQMIPRNVKLPNLRPIKNQNLLREARNQEMTASEYNGFVDSPISLKWCEELCAKLPAFLVER